MSSFDLINPTTKSSANSIH